MEISFSKWLETKWEDDNMFPPAMSDTEFRKFIEMYLLPSEFYIVGPLTTAQANVEILDFILRKYSKLYKNELKRGKKNV